MRYVRPLAAAFLAALFAAACTQQQPAPTPPPPAVTVANPVTMEIGDHFRPIPVAATPQLEFYRSQAR
jgi:hypothetical protein